MATWAEERRAWQEAMLKAARANDYEMLVRLMANNQGDRGDVEMLIDNFVANCDPADGWRETGL